MSKQLSLCEYPTRNRLEKQYREWASNHPIVIELFEHFAHEMASRGRRFSISLLTERIRWESKLRWGNVSDDYKLNNNYRAYIARDLVAKHPYMKNLIETRTVQEDAHEAH